jgi:dTDP-4-amino-4,6-dideoxygalactose transaminase
VLIDFEAAGLSRGETMRRLRAAGVGAQVHYMPVHRQPYYRARYGPLDLPGAECYYKRCLSLPLYAAMTDDDVLRVADSLCDALS